MKGLVIDSGPVIENIKVLKVDKLVPYSVAGIIKTTLRQAPIEGFCASFGQEPSTASGTGICALVSSA